MSTILINNMVNIIIDGYDLEIEKDITDYIREVLYIKCGYTFKK